MVLLQGLNYDFGGQVSSTLSSSVAAAATSVAVENTEGFAVDDYLLLDPNNEKAEIVKISAITSATVLGVSALSLAHDANTDVFRLPYNQMKFYYCATATGTYVAIDTIDMDYAKQYTPFEYVAGTSALYYKRTFYNETTTTESDIALADYWQTSDEELYITPEELRVFLQFGENDYPTASDMKTFIKIAQDKITLEVDSSNNVILRLATFMLSKALVLRGLATKAVSKGYVTVNAEGRNITKAFQELVLEAENITNEYVTFINALTRSEVSSTNFMDDTTVIDAATRQEYIDLWTGTQNAMDGDTDDRTLYGRSRRN